MTPKAPRGTFAGLALIFIAVVLGPLISMAGEEPQIGRFVGAGFAAVGIIAYTLGFSYDDTFTPVGKRSTAQRLVSLFAGLGLLGVPLYVLLSGLAIPFWIRAAASAALIVSGVAMAVIAHKAEGRRAHPHLVRETIIGDNSQQ